jgi:hypothetical protein
MGCRDHDLLTSWIGERGANQLVQSLDRSYQLRPSVAPARQFLAMWVSGSP